LSEFGLSDHESRIYWALVENGPCSMSELAQKANVPRTKVYANVRKLQKKGFVEFLPEKKYMCRAVSPEATLKPLLEKKKDELDSMEEQLNRLVDLFSQIKDKDGVERKEFWTIKEKSRGVKTLKDELGQAEEEVVMVLNKSCYALLKELRDDLRAAYNRKVKNRVIAPLITDQLSKLEGFRDFVDIHVANKEPEDNLIVVDRKTTIIINSMRLSQDPSSYSLIYIKDKGLAENIVAFADLLWGELPDIASVLSLVKTDDVPKMARAATASVYYNTVLYAFGKTLVDTFGEKKAAELIRKAGELSLQLLEEEEGVKLVKGNIEESLRLMTDLASVSEKIEINYSSEDPLRTLFYEVTDATSISYKKSKELKTDILMTAWGVLTEAIFSKHGYYTITLQTIYDEQKQLWITRKRVYRKEDNQVKPLDYLFHDISTTTNAETENNKALKT
ncbi:MAG: helix-turn-helix domain-containing protein, partial [Thermoprotei archaeon]